MHRNGWRTSWHNLAVRRASWKIDFGRWTPHDLRPYSWLSWPRFPKQFCTNHLFFFFLENWVNKPPKKWHVTGGECTYESLVEFEWCSELIRSLQWFHSSCPRSTCRVQSNPLSNDDWPLETHQITHDDCKYSMCTAQTIHCYQEFELI